MMSDVLDDCFQRILLHHTAIRFVATNSFPFNYFKTKCVDSVFHVKLFYQFFIYFTYYLRSSRWDEVLIEIGFVVC